MAAKLFEPAEFTVFYNAYRKHTHRDEALGAWRKLAPNSELIATIMRDIDTRQWPETQFVPNAATYLNKRRWLDERPICDRVPIGSQHRSGGALNEIRMAANEAERMSPEERATARRKFQEIIASIGDKGLR